MKKIIVCSLLFVLNMSADHIEGINFLPQLKEEFARVADLAKQKYDESATHRATLLKTAPGKEYQSVMRNWFNNNCENNNESSLCKDLAQKLQDRLAHLQKTEIYTQDYLPALEEYYVNAQKFYALPLMISIMQQPEQLNSRIDLTKDRILYVIDGMKVEGDSEPSKIWLELSHDRGALNKQAQKELTRGFVENMK